MSLCKSDLLEHVAKTTAEDLTITKKDLKVLLDATFEAIKSMALEESLVIRDFGVFKTKNRLARKCRHPVTGNLIDVPASRSLGFKASHVEKLSH